MSNVSRTVSVFFSADDCAARGAAMSNAASSTVAVPRMCDTPGDYGGCDRVVCARRRTPKDTAPAWSGPLGTQHLGQVPEANGETEARTGQVVPASASGYQAIFMRTGIRSRSRTRGNGAAP